MTAYVRPMTEDEIEAAATVQAEAFGDDIEAQIRNYREGPGATWRDGWVVEADGAISAAALAYPTTWWFGGAGYPISAIGGVAVHPVARRRGFASQLMRGILQADYEAGRPFSLLYPFQHGFYRRLGYATVGLTHLYRIAIAHIPDDPLLRSKVRVFRDTDREAIYALYHRSLLTGVGGLERNADQWEWRRTKGEEKWIVYDDGGVRGYLAYRRNERQLDVREWVALTPEAERGLWAFLAAQIEYSRSVTCHAPIDKPLWAVLHEPIMFEAHQRGLAFYDAATLSANLMARLVDVPAAFARRHFSPDLAGDLTFALRDPVLDANNTMFTITFSDGKADVSRTNVEPAAMCDIMTLSQLFCGVLRASTARWYGRLDASDAATELLDQALAGPSPFIHPSDWF